MKCVRLSKREVVLDIEGNLVHIPNSKTGRVRLKETVKSAKLYKSIMAEWGDKAAIDEA